MIGVLIGGTAGFVVGVVGWLAFFHRVFMLPKGTEFQYSEGSRWGLWPAARSQVGGAL